jgi:hypothetical protein
VIASGSLPPDPWTTVQSSNCRLFWLASDATDSGNPNYSITSITDKKGGAALNSIDGAAPERIAPPASQIGWVPSAAGHISRNANASMATAVANGDHSFVLRCAAPSAVYCLDDYSGFRGAFIAVTSTLFTYSRYNGLSYEWTASYSALSAGPHTFGLSVDRSPGTTLVAFYVDGALVGTDTDNTRDVVYVSPSESLGNRLNPSNSGNYRGGGNWSSLLTLSDHQAIHAYFEAVDS